MSSRIFSSIIVLLVTACGGAADDAASGGGNQGISSNTIAAEAQPERVACAIGRAEYADDCTIDRVATDEGTVLTIRHPDGGFRRLRVSADGEGIAAADGAVPTEILKRSGTTVEVAIGDARYRLPSGR